MDRVFRNGYMSDVGVNVMVFLFVAIGKSI